MRVLIGYASPQGSTRGIAERIGAVFAQHDVPADVRPLDQVENADAYEAFVLGSAIHNGVWMPEAAEFVRRNLDSLTQRPVWLFSVGMLGDEASAFAPMLARLFRRMRNDPTGLAGTVDAIHPEDNRAFVGVVQRGDWSRVAKLIFKAMGGRYGDHRDWLAIDTWAETIAVAVQSAGKQVTTSSLPEPPRGAQPTP